MSGKKSSKTASFHITLRSSEATGSWTMDEFIRIPSHDKSGEVCKMRTLYCSLLANCRETQLEADFHPALSSLSAVAGSRFLNVVPCWLKGGTWHLLHLWLILIGCSLATHLDGLQCKVCLRGSLVTGGWDVREDSQTICFLERCGRLRSLVYTT